MRVEISFSITQFADRKGNNKVSKSKLKKYLFGNKTREKLVNFAPQGLLLIKLDVALAKCQRATIQNKY